MSAGCCADPVHAPLGECCVEKHMCLGPSLGRPPSAESVFQSYLCGPQCLVHIMGLCQMRRIVVSVGQASKWSVGEVWRPLCWATVDEISELADVGHGPTWSPWRLLPEAQGSLTGHRHTRDTLREPSW